MLSTCIFSVGTFEGLAPQYQKAGYAEAHNDCRLQMYSHLCIIYCRNLAVGQCLHLIALTLSKIKICPVSTTCGELRITLYSLNATIESEFLEPSYRLILNLPPFNEAIVLWKKCQKYLLSYLLCDQPKNIINILKRYLLKQR